MKVPTQPSKMLFYESIAHSFDSVVNMYDTRKRVSVIFSELLPPDITGKQFLDAGCGTGWVSAEAAARGAQVTSMDMGPELLKEVAKKAKTKTVVGSILEMPFADNSFDIVVSTEVIEHVTEPLKAIQEMHRVLKPGGVVVITTPNAFWHWAIRLSNALHLRPYQGLENWLSWDQFMNAHTLLGYTTLKKRGIHTFPFILGFTHPLLDFLDRFHGLYDRYMVNMCISARKAA